MLREDLSRAIAAAEPLPLDLLATYFSQRPRDAREFIAELADQMIQLRDVLDVDPDLEDVGDDEPTMGFRETGAGARVLSLCRASTSASPTATASPASGASEAVAARTLPINVGGLLAISKTASRMSRTSHTTLMAATSSPTSA